MKKVISFCKDSSYSNYGSDYLDVEVTSYHCNIDGWVVLVALNTVDDAGYVGSVEVSNGEEAEELEKAVCDLFVGMEVLPELKELNELLAFSGIKLEI